MLKNLKENSQTSPLLKPFFNTRYSWLAAACTAGIMLVVYFCYDLIPFGDTTILRMDLYHQYGPLFAELYERITNFDSLIYSWTSGGGSAFLGNFFNYLSSPFLVVMLLLGHKNMPEAIAVMVLLKAAVAAFTFSYFLSKKNKESSPLTSAFGVLYACSGYFIAYYWNIMWIDSFYLFPLVMLGIEKIISERKLKLYTITLALTLITNYYMGYMVCIFSVLYFIYYFFSNYNFTDTYFGKLAKREKGIKGFISWGYNNLRNSRFFDNGCKFAFCSIGAGMLSAFMLLPVYFILANCSATSGTFPEEFKTYFSIFDFLANHLAYLDPTIRSSGTDVLPNVYCGILTVMLVPLFIFSNKISLKEKIMSCGILGIMFASCYTNYLNYIWHGFHFPNDLPYRFSYMYSFLLLIFAYKAIKNIKEYTNRQIIGVGVATIFFIILVQEIGSKNFSETGVWICVAFIGIYCLALGILKNDKYPAIAAAALVLCSVCAEYTVANTNNYSMDQTKTNFVGDYDNFQKIKDKIDEYEGNESYRMELTALRARMDPCWYYYNGLSTFTSMAYESVANMQSNLGMFSNFINSYTYHRQTPVYNSFFALDYVVDNYTGSKASMNTKFYKELFTVDKYTAYENLYQLPIAFRVNEEIRMWSHD
ncbi:MAG: YfhO family protein, partial [Acutalibacteraceae bacterium]|nr:YfhO family protein [Acutalibacteraceae bacterium]